MKRVVICLAAIASILVSPFVRAEENFATLNDSQLALIRTNCVATRASLERLHANDALARVNLGREYETISTKLMAPMNSRIALNNLNGIATTKTTADFNSELADFRTSYQQYEQTVARTLETDCKKSPADFYHGVEQARIYRSEVRESVVKMSALIKQYKTDVESIQKGSTAETSK